MFAIRLLVCGFLAIMVPACAHQTWGDPGLPVAGRVLGTTIHTRDAEELRYVVLQKLTDRYADENGITVTQAETDAYVARMRQRMRTDRAERLARRDELTRRLATPALPESERRTLAAELDAEEKLLAALGDPDAAAPSAEDARARQEIATAFIRQWKINRALYRQYGGRIAFQQGGPEPLDAYRRFLEERHARGDFEIVDRALESAFWRYYRTDTLHSFYPPGSPEEARAFSVPWWLSE
jgi:hypothetical protein